MADILDFTGILYYLIIPILVGLGVDSHYKHRHVVSVVFGLIFFSFCSFWVRFGPDPTLSELEPILILIPIALSLFLNSAVFERKSSTSVFQRNSLTFLAISLAGLPLFGIKNIIEEKMQVEYPASLLPLLEFTLALMALVVVANIFESGIYARKEGAQANKREFQMDDDLMIDNDSLGDLDF